MCQNMAVSSTRSTPTNQLPRINSHESTPTRSTPTRVSAKSALLLIVPLLSLPCQRTAWKSSENATTLCSTAWLCIRCQSNNVMKSGELILVDAGAEYNYYASDITRTFPVNGRFSKTQKRLYNKLLKIQKKMISCLAPKML